MPRTGRPKVNAIVRFWNQTEKSDECWNWIGAKDGDGYGQFTDETGRNQRAHRFSWLIHFGEIPEGIRVLHKCDNPSCINPDHLFLGTDADNLEDAIAKGRLKIKGEDNPAAKLTESQVKEIRSRYVRKSYRVSNKLELAIEFGITPDHLDQIVNRKCWKHI